ncbi:hypothetical protein ACOMHN_023738 [Nucella lapillus]
MEEGAEELVSQPLYQTTVTVWKVLSPPILILGTAGNLLSLCVLSTLPPPTTSTSTLTPSFALLMRALAVSNTVLLCSGLLRRLMQFWGRDVRLTHDVACRLDVFLVYLSAMTSAWLLVTMTLQRAVAGVCPLGRWKGLTTQRRAQLTLVVIVATLGVLKLSLLLSLSLHPDPQRHNHTLVCDLSTTAPPALRHFVRSMFPWVDMTLTSILPSVLLLFSNMGLAFTLVRVSRRLEQHATHAQTVPSTSGSIVTAVSAANARRANSASALTFRLICLSVTFLCLTSPVVILILVELYHRPLAQKDLRVEARWSLVTAVCHLLWYANSAINFYLYFMISRHFRARCRRLLTCGRFR